MKLFEEIRKTAVAALKSLKGDDIEYKSKKEIIKIIHKVQVGELSIKEIKKLTFKIL